MKWDLLVPIFIYLILLIVVAYCARLNAPAAKSFEESFFLGGRSLGPVLLAFTMSATICSAGTFIGIPGLIYSSGFAWFIMIAAQIPVVLYSLGALGKKMSIISRRIDAVTITDILKARYQNNLVTIGSAIAILVFISAFMIAQIVGGTRIIQSVTGLPYEWGLIIFFPIVIIYLLLGGFLAITWTDLLQGFIMMAGSVVLLVIVLSQGASLAHITTAIAVESPHLMSLPGPLNITPLYFLSFFLLFGLGVIGLPTLAVRAMAFRDTRSMRQAIIIGSIVIAFFTICMGLVGYMARYYMPGLPSGDMAIPLMVLEFLPGWLAGVFLMVPLMAGMSTVDAMLLLLVSIIVRDLFQNYIKPDASQAVVLKFTYIATITIAVIVFILAASPPPLLQLLIIFAAGGVVVSLFVPLLFGLYWRRANAYGAICSLFGGVFAYIILEYFFEGIFKMHSFVPSLIISMTLMIAVSLLTKKPGDDVIALFWGRHPLPNNIESVQEKGRHPVYGVPHK